MAQTARMFIEKKTESRSDVILPSSPLYEGKVRFRSFVVKIQLRFFETRALSKNKRVLVFRKPSANVLSGRGRYQPTRPSGGLARTASSIYLLMDNNLTGRLKARIPLVRADSQLGFSALAYPEISIFASECALNRSAHLNDSPIRPLSSMGR